MFRVSILVIFVLFGWTCCRAFENNCTYTIITSRVIKAGRPHQFSVTTKCDVETNLVLKVWLASESINSSQKIFRLKTGITKTLAIAIPKPLRQVNYFFCVEGSGGLTFYENRSVTVGRKLSSLFIQTDKAVYKPDDRVLFRTLALNSDLKPSNSTVNVTIFDPKGNRLYQSLNIHTKNGITNGNLKLSKSTILGVWTITAKSKGESKNYRFEVKEYVLPKFKVEVNVPQKYHVNIHNPANQKNMSIAVEARYTYGQPVKGISLITISHDSYYQTRGNRPSISKTIKLEDGKVTLIVTSSELLDLISCHYGQPTLEYQSFRVEANVTEIATGIIISEKKLINARSGRYYLEAVTRVTYFKPGFPFKIMFKLNQLNNEPVPPSDVWFADGTPRNIPVVIYFGFGDHSASSLEQRYLTNLTSDGHSFLTIETNANIKSLRIEAAYYDEYANDTIRSYSYFNAFQTKNQEQIQLDLGDSETEIQADKSSTFTVRSSKPITTFQYQIFSKSALFVSQIVTGENSTIHSFVVNTSKDFVSNVAPEALVVVSYVDASGELVVDSITVPVVNYFFNEVHLSFSKNITHPSDEVFLNIIAGKDSTIALLGVDQSVRLLKSGNDISKDEVVRDFREYGHHTFPSRNDGKFVIRAVDGQDTKALLNNAGVMIITNNYIHEIPSEYPAYEEDSDAPGMTSKRRMKFVSSTRAETQSFSGDSLSLNNVGSSGDMSQPRTEFPETWIWADIDNMDNESTQLTFKLPDTITSWVVSAFAVSGKEGFGIATPVEITVFKPMFVSLNLPYSVVRSEEFALVATVFNYLDTDLDVEVSLERSTYFQIRRCDSTNLLETFESTISKQIKINKKDSEGIYFWIVPTKVGLIPIEVKVTAGSLVDIINVNLLVKPEGQPQSYSFSALLGSSVHNESNVNFQVTLPSHDILVPGSIIVEVFVIGNIFASTIENIQNLVNLPAACGEQNIITFAPNIYILNFLSATNELSKEKKDSLTDHLLAGFAQQLTFQRQDGSYSAFGDKDDSGSVWLSAFVAKSFQHSKSYLPFEPKTVVKTLKWILSHQQFDGSFAEPPLSKIIHSKMQGGSSSGVSLTAYVLIALQENKMHKKVIKTLDANIKNATIYLEQHYPLYENDSYTLSIIAYSFYLVKSRHFANVFTMLERQANKTGESIHWQTQVSTSQFSNAWKPFYEKPLTYDIEATAYALLIYSAQGNTDSLLIAKWLISQRNEAGGFRSTQDTVIALEALSKFARVLTLQESEYNLNAFVESDIDNRKHDLTKITKENSFLLQSIELPENSNQIKVTVEGKGYAVAQMKVKYNTKKVIEHPLLELNVSATTSKDILTLGISSGWLGEEASGMVIIEVEMITGWEVHDESQLFQELVNKVKKIENKGSKIIFYLNELIKHPLNLEITLVNKLSIFGAKPALVKVYQYYEPDTHASAFYSSLGKQTWLTACPECCS